MAGNLRKGRPLCSCMAFLVSLIDAAFSFPAFFVISLMCYSGNAINFRGVVNQTLLTAERDVYCLDLRNHGKSFHSKETMSLDSVAE